MRKHSIILAAVFAIPSAALAAAPTSHQRSGKAVIKQLAATTIAARMSRALQGEARVEVRGSTVGPGKQTVTYLMRYQAGAREFLQESGGVWSHVQVGKQALTGLRAVSIGKVVYSTVDGSHWMRASRTTPPSALDVISINPANAPCCVTRHGSAAQVWNAGRQSWHARSVYALGYITTSVNASIRGTLLVDPQSFRPLQYTESSKLPAMTGTFSLSYGGSFSINRPASR
ncbi:MAG TPA: hypothetical protein VF221_03380 [Chloroflexota bacterium]